MCNELSSAASCIASFIFSICLNVLLDSVVPSPNCPFALLPVVHTVPSVFKTAVKALPVAISIAFVIVVFVGSVLFLASPRPNCPTVFFPHDQTVPSDFNETKYSVPPEILANAAFPSSVTFTFTAPYIPFLVSAILIYVVPLPTAVILFSLTVTILVSNDSKLIDVSFGSFITFNSFDKVTSISLVSPTFMLTRLWLGNIL